MEAKVEEEERVGVEERLGVEVEEEQRVGVEERV